ncbi:DUF6510 family protein [Nocardiopsis protaetiae]|uniref:DUF6510 family protein n=1 Tax=Nocardiopsis protaetiae TaxID=3382270 RepID=UPI00387AD1FF
MHHLDGNVLSGSAADLFAFEATAAQGRCRSCADIAALGQALVYGLPMGHVARCRNCDNVLLIIVEHGGRRSLDMRGLCWIRVAAGH